MKIEASAALERHDTRKTPEPQFGAREICENTCRSTKSFFHRPNALIQLGFTLWGTVGIIEAAHVDAGL
jgi:hypothetical protein